MQATNSIKCCQFLSFLPVELFAFTAAESSQDMLDEEVEAETQGFEETGGLEDNPAPEEASEEEMGEEGEEMEEAAEV